MILKSIEESQQEFLERLKPHFREWIDFDWYEFICKWYVFERISENYYKNILVYLPSPIGKLVYERFKNNITIEDVFKYYMLKKMHTFSENDNDKVQMYLACFSEEINRFSL